MIEMKPKMGALLNIWNFTSARALDPVTVHPKILYFNILYILYYYIYYICIWVFCPSVVGHRSHTWPALSKISSSWWAPPSLLVFVSIFDKYSKLFAYILHLYLWVSTPTYNNYKGISFESQTFRSGLSL